MDEATMSTVNIQQPITIRNQLNSIRHQMIRKRKTAPAIKQMKVQLPPIRNLVIDFSKAVPKKQAIHSPPKGKIPLQFKDFLSSHTINRDISKVIFTNHNPNHRHFTLPHHSPPSNHHSTLSHHIPLHRLPSTRHSSLSQYTQSQQYTSSLSKQQASSSLEQKSTSLQYKTANAHSTLQPLKSTNMSPQISLNPKQIKQTKPYLHRGQPRVSLYYSNMLDVNPQRLLQRRLMAQKPRRKLQLQDYIPSPCQRYTPWRYSRDEQEETLY